MASHPVRSMCWERRDDRPEGGQRPGEVMVMEPSQGGDAFLRIDESHPHALSPERRGRLDLPSRRRLASSPVQWRLHIKTRGRGFIPGEHDDQDLTDGPSPVSRPPMKQARKLRRIYSSVAWIVQSALSKRGDPGRGSSHNC
jgi:hypothetical protein